MNKYSLENKTATCYRRWWASSFTACKCHIKKKNGNLILVDIDKAKLARNIKVLKSHFKRNIYFFVCDITKEKKVLALKKN